MVEFKEILEARYMTFSSPPTTNDALQLTSSVLDLIQSIEKRKRKRKANDKKAFREAVGLILGDLLLGFEQEENRWSYHGLSAAAFSEAPVGYDNFKITKSLMEKQSLIEVVLGRNHRPFTWEEGQEETFAPGRATRFRPTDAHIQLAEDNGITKDTIHEHFITHLPRKVIEVRKASKGKLKGKKMKVPETRQYKELEWQVLLINQFLSSFTYEAMSFGGLRRIFNEGDAPNFNFDRGGRLNHADGGGYIRMNKDKRKLIKIDGEDVVEVDINATYISIMHGIKQQPLPTREDIYAIGNIPREVVKMWFAISFGLGRFPRQWLPKSLREIKEKCPEYKPWMTARKVEKVVLEYFPFMADLPLEDIGWSKLMYLESEIVIGTILELMSVHNAPALPVYDCVIVRKSDQELAMRILSEQFYKQTGLVPKLKTGF